MPWQHFYLGTLVLSTINFVFLAFSFLPTERELEESGTLAQLSDTPPVSPDGDMQTKPETGKLPVDLSIIEKGIQKSGSALPSSCQSGKTRLA